MCRLAQVAHQVSFAGRVVIDHSAALDGSGCLAIQVVQLALHVSRDRHGKRVAMFVVKREITLQANPGQLDRRPPRFRGQSLRGREVPKVVPVLIDARDFGTNPEIESAFQTEMAWSSQISKLWCGYG